MATTNPTPNYKWILPVPGGSIGSWGTILNKIFGNAPPLATGEVLGVDGVLKAIETDVGTAKTDIAALDTRIDTLEAAGSSAFYGRIYRSSAQSIPHATLTQVVFNAESFDQGDTASGDTITVPSGAAGLWQVRAQVEVPFHATGDDSQLWRMEIHKGGTKIAEARTPFMNDGVSSGSGNITLSAAALDVGAESDEYTVHVYQEHPGFGGGSKSVQAGEAKSFLEAVRLIAA